jgi:hypothetical protein
MFPEDEIERYLRTARIASPRPRSLWVGVVALILGSAGRRGAG